MQPETPRDLVNVENGRVQERTGLNSVGELNTKDKTVESGLGKEMDRFEQLSEARAATADAGSTTVALPSISTSKKDDDEDTTSDDSTPMIAGDDDVMEKEWVDKAKNIVDTTKHDPYLREEKVSKLQVEYQKKRYGRDLGSPVG